MQTVKIYALKDPISNIIKYIGRSVNPKNRFKQHIFSARKDGKKDIKSAWIRSILDIGLIPIIEIIDECLVDEAITREMYWIKYYMKENKLTNQRDYVENNYLFSESTRKKMSDSQKGNRNRLGKGNSEETRKKLSIALAGRISSNKGKTASLETRDKLKAAWQKRKPDSIETRNRKSEAAKLNWQIRKNKIK